MRCSSLPHRRQGRRNTLHRLATLSSSSNCRVLGYEHNRRSKCSKCAKRRTSCTRSLIAKLGRRRCRKLNSTLARKTRLRSESRFRPARLSQCHCPGDCRFSTQWTASRIGKAVFQDVDQTWTGRRDRNTCVHLVRITTLVDGTSGLGHGRRES